MDWDDHWDENCVFKIRMQIGTGFVGIGRIMQVGVTMRIGIMLIKMMRIGMRIGMELWGKNWNGICVLGLEHQGTGFVGI